MGYGLSISNASGYIQVDENYSNYSLYSSGWASDGATIYFPSGCICMVRAAYGSNIYAYGRDITSLTMNGASWEYRVYRRTGDVGHVTSGMGLNVYNGSGTCTFSSQDSTLRIATSAIIGQDINLPYTIPSPGYAPFINPDVLKPIGWRTVSNVLSVLMSPSCTFNGDNSLYLSTISTSHTLPFAVSSNWAGHRSVLVGK